MGAASGVPVPGTPPLKGMLFVRMADTHEAMTKAPLIIAGLIVAILAMPAQASFGSARALDLVVGPDGTTHVSAEIAVDSPGFRVGLLGPPVDNLVATDGSGARLPLTVVDGMAVFGSVPASTATIAYDTHDLVSKDGRVWTFSLDSPSGYSLEMPENSVIVMMDASPGRIVAEGGKMRLELAAGPARIDYVFGARADPQPEPAGGPDFVAAGLIAGPIITAGVAASIILRRRRAPPREAGAGHPDPRTIFGLRPDMREDDKEIVRFIHGNGGQALESTLRREFLQPRTTMWRAVKRLERMGVVEIYKKDKQNVVRLRREVEGEG